MWYEVENHACSMALAFFCQSKSNASKCARAFFLLCWKNHSFETIIQISNQFGNHVNHEELWSIKIGDTKLRILLNLIETLFSAQRLHANLSFIRVFSPNIFVGRRQFFNDFPDSFRSFADTMDAEFMIGCFCFDFHASNKCFSSHFVAIFPNEKAWKINIENSQICYFLNTHSQMIVFIGACDNSEVNFSSIFLFLLKMFKLRNSDSIILSFDWVQVNVLCFIWLRKPVWYIRLPW